MKVTLDCVSAANALKTIVNVTGAEHAHMEVRKKDIWVSASGQDRNVRVLIKGEVAEAGEPFGFNIYSLQSTVAGAKDLLIHQKKNMLHFEAKDKRSKFNGEFHTVPFEDIEILLDDEARNVKIDGSTMNALTDAVNKVSITNVMGNDPMALWIKLNKKGLFATVYLDSHLAYVHNSGVTSKSETEFNIPIPLWTLISSVSGGEDYELSVGKVYVTARALGFELSVPWLQSSATEQQDFETADTFVKAIENRVNKADSLEIPHSELTDAMDKLSSVSDGKSGVCIESNGKNAVFKLESSFGKAQIEKRDVKTSKWKSSYLVNPLLLRDLLARFPSDNVKMLFTEEMLVFIDETKTTRAVYSCLLIQ